MTEPTIIDAEFVEADTGTQLAPRSPEPSLPPPVTNALTNTMGVLEMQRELLGAQHRALCDMLRQMELPVFGGEVPSAAPHATPSAAPPPQQPPPQPGGPIHIMEQNMQAMDRAIESIFSSLRHTFNASAGRGDTDVR